jgi:hypothetical protein
VTTQHRLGLESRNLTIWAVIAAGKHLFPFRTEKLSPLAPMVLGEQSPGRVGRRPFLSRALRGALAVFLVPLEVVLGGAQPLAPLGIERSQPADTFSERRMSHEQRRQALLGERIRRVERLRRG